MEIQTWYVAIDVNDELIAMFLSKDDCDRFCQAKEEMTNLSYTQDEYQMGLKR